MLIKEADDQTHVLAELERTAAGAGPEAKRAKTELRNRKAGIRGESESAYLIDFDYGSSPNWAVIHDLRLEYHGRTAQIDHVLINRWMEFFVLETKTFHAGVKITDEGEFLRWNDFTRHYEGMPSPVQQNERHIAVLSDVVAEIQFPSRFGSRITPTFNSLVLVSPSARIIRPKEFDTSRVIKADQLKPRIWRDLDLENPLNVFFKAATRMVSSETVRFVGEQLAALHARATTGIGPAPAAVPERPHAVPTSATRIAEPVSAAFARQTKVPQAAATSPSCKQCGLGQGSILYGKYGYYFKCDGCGTNTSVRFACHPGHHPRVRKDGRHFYRDCTECGTSALFHTNVEAPTG